MTEYTRIVKLFGSLEVCKPDGACELQEGEFLRTYKVNAKSLSQAHFKLNELLEAICDGRFHKINKNESVICNTFEYIEGFSEPVQK